MKINAYSQNGIVAKKIGNYLDHHGAELKEFFHSNQKLINIPDCPEGALFAEILANALYVLEYYPNRTGVGSMDCRATLKETKAWINLGKCGTISFDDCLALLSAEPQQLKKAILENFKHLLED